MIYSKDFFNNPNKSKLQNLNFFLNLSKITQEEMDKRIVEFVKPFTFLEGIDPIVLFSVGFGVSDKPDHVHTKAIISKLSGAALKEFELYQKDPFASKIKYSPAIKIYNAVNEIFAGEVWKVKAKVPKLLILGKPISTQTIEFSPAEIDFSDFLFKLR